MGVRLTKAFHICYCIVMSLIFGLVLWTMFEGGYIFCLLIAIILYAVYQFAGKGQQLKKRNYDVIWNRVVCVSFVCMLVMAFGMRVEYSWDWGRLLVSASYYVENGVLDMPEYFARYPNNCFWLFCLVGLFRLVKCFWMTADTVVFYHVSIVVSCLLIQLTICYIYKTARLLWGDRGAFKVGILSVLCLPFYLYALFLYTDSPGMLLASMLLYYYFKMKKTNVWKKKVVYSVLLGVLAALAYMTKVTAFIVFIAILIDVIRSVRSFRRCGVVISIMLLSIAVTGGTVSFVVSRQLGITEEMKDEYQFPLAHWVMMGLDGSGGYDQRDVDFTDSFETYEEKKEANVQEIKNRIQQQGTLGILRHIFIDKMKRTWGNSCMGGDDYVSRSPENPNGILQKIFANRGVWHSKCLIYSWTYHVLIVAGILLSGIKAVRRDGSQQLFVGRIAIFGFVVFLAIWECNSRYLLTCLPVMILVVAEGLVNTK